ncbi:MAG: type II 3-dehydroquinate dehydratase [Ilumatobacteraceae bacterium]
MGERRRVLVLSGPNLNLLGSREPDVYGSSTLSEIVELAAGEAKSLGLEVEHRHSNQASQLVEWIQQAEHEAIVINPGAFTHYAWSIHDALRSFRGRIVEVHLSEPLRRESWRHQSVVAPVADGTISGFGGRGYSLAMHAVAQLLAD